MSLESSPASSIRYPFRQSNVLLSVDYVEAQHTWTLRIERGIRRHSVRLSRSAHDQATAENVALISVRRRLVDELSDDKQSASALARQLIAIVSLGANLPAGCSEYLQWRMCEEILSFRKRRVASA